MDSVDLQSESMEFEKINEDDRLRVNTYLEDPPTLQLKKLLEHIEYAFLQGESSLPVIISSHLTGS